MWNLEDTKLLIPILLLLPLILMIIYRRWGDTLAELLGDFSSTTKIEPVAVPVAPLNIPFTVQLRKQPDCYSLQICSSVDNWIVYEVRNIKIETTLSDILKIDRSNGYFHSISEVLELEDTQNTKYDISGTHEMTLRPGVSDTSPGEKRSKYPLLLFITNNIDSLVCPIHVGDNFIKASYIIAQFYRNADGTFHRLTALYSGVDSVEDECSVCLTNRASCAILPCRHRCACDSCITRLTHCPMCRSTISSYFNTSDQDPTRKADS